MFAVIALACLLASASTARAQTAAADPADGGALLLQGHGVATALPAVRLGTDMDVTVTGPIMRVRVTQAFRNTSAQWMEASYLYPLPDDGAVDTLKMVVGQRVIVGRIKRKGEARAMYEAAKAQGRKGGLVESERPNLFRTSVANVGPGETVLIAIEYQAPVRLLGGEYAVRLPLVVGPRYVPGDVSGHASGDAQPRGGERPRNEAGRVTAPLAASKLAASKLGIALNPVSITVHLAPGFVPANIISPYHRISVAAAGTENRTITLAAGEEPADRDFELRWRSASADPVLALFRQMHGGEHHVMAMITPPAQVEQAVVPPREMIFVIDNSGSMGGEPMAAAKQSLLHALGTLRPQDTFNVIRFDDTLTQLFERPTPASAEQVELARRFTIGLEASGGTEMLPALKAALADATPDAPGLRQVVFLTDGSLSNEQDMMAEIAAHGGRSRVFMVGIGAAPNGFLMRRMAEAGRGTYTSIGDGAEVMPKMTALLNRLKAPVVRALAVRVEGTALDLAPQNLPDLYAGEPLVLLGKGADLDGKLIVSGTMAGQPWTRTVDLAQAGESPAVARLWAGRRIADVEARRWSGQIADAAADEAIAALGLDHGLVTTQTSLVAVDDTPSRPAGLRLTREDLPLLLPKGWDFDGLLGHQSAAAPRAGDPMPEQQVAMDLPQTATGFAHSLQQGMALLVAGLLGLAGAARRRRRAKGAAA